MNIPLADEFEKSVHEIDAALKALPESLAETPWRAGGWTRKQIVGHLLDSAANNRQRFVRAAIDGAYAGPGYAQQEWVDAHGYADLPWKTLLDWWRIEHEILTAIVCRIPAARLQALCTIGDDAPMTLESLVRDYLRHQFHHLRQMSS